MISCATDRRLRPLGYARRDAGCAAVPKRVVPSETQSQINSDMLSNEGGSYKVLRLAPTESKAGTTKAVQPVPLK